jgi:hypothetical protein
MQGCRGCRGSRFQTPPTSIFAHSRSHYVNGTQLSFFLAFQRRKLCVPRLKAEDQRGSVGLIICIIANKAKLPTYLKTDKASIDDLFSTPSVSSLLFNIS